MNCYICNNLNYGVSLNDQCYQNQVISNKIGYTTNNELVPNVIGNINNSSSSINFIIK